MHKWWRLADNPKDVSVFNFERNLNIKTLDIMEICFKPQWNLTWILTLKNTKKLLLIFYPTVSLNILNFPWSQNKQCDLSGLLSS